jgi:hypothetical protein
MIASNSRHLELTYPLRAGGHPHMLLRAVPVRHHRLQAGAVGGTHLDADALTHPQQVGARTAVGTLPSDAVH